MIVVKLGGSLYDLPDLKWRLSRFLDGLPDADRLVVPGGGALADAIRALDRTHALGPAASHWLALEACSLNASFLRHLLPEARIVDWPTANTGLNILDAVAFARRDADDADALPASWDATSDALAARAAIVAKAELILLKSVTMPAEMTWPEAATAGIVDALLPALIAKQRVRVRVVNLRDVRLPPHPQPLSP